MWRLEMPREEAEGADAVLFTLEDRHLVAFKWELQIGDHPSFMWVKHVKTMPFLPPMTNV
jgi:hypothetical protein